MPDRPCLIVASDGHNACLNTRGLAAVGGEKATAYVYAAFSRRGPAVRAAIAEAFSAGPQLQEAVRREADQTWQRALSAGE